MNVILLVHIIGCFGVGIAMLVFLYAILHNEKGERNERIV